MKTSINLIPTTLIRHLVILLFAIQFATINLLQSQTPVTLNPGDSIRISASDFKIEKKVVLLKEVIENDFIIWADSMITIPVWLLDNCEIRTKKSHFAEGVILGTLAGALYGAIKNEGGDFGGLGALPGGLVGAFIGGVVGSQVNSMRWEKVWPKNIQFKLTTLDQSRLGLGIAVLF